MLLSFAEHTVPKPRRGGLTLNQGKRSVALSLGAKGTVVQIACRPLVVQSVRKLITSYFLPITSYFSPPSPLLIILCS